MQADAELSPFIKAQVPLDRPGAGGLETRSLDPPTDGGRAWLGVPLAKL